MAGAAGVVTFFFSCGNWFSIPEIKDRRVRRLLLPKGSGLIKIHNGTLAYFHFAFTKIDTENGGLCIAPGATFNFCAYPRRVLYKKGRQL